MHKETIEWGGRELTLETGKIAKQANGSVLARYGDTVILATVVIDEKIQDNLDFVPFSVHYQEKAYAAGRIPGGFFKREGKPSEKEVLVSRLIDRPLRPLFPEGFSHEVQLVCTLLSYDPECDTEVAASIAASAAMIMAGFSTPVATARVGYKNDAYVLNPVEKTELDLIVSGTANGVLMVESEANQLSEEIMLGAVEFGHKHFQVAIKAIEELAKKVGVKKIKTEGAKYPHLKEIKERFTAELKKIYKQQDKIKRRDLLRSAKEEIIAEFADVNVGPTLTEIEYNWVREQILKNKKRLDGREYNQVRNISCEVGILPRTHGSALFTRGETQVLAVTTLGTSQDEQVMDAIGGEYKERFMLHYEFPSYSVGEVGRVGAPGRREIGHGKLAWRAINPLIPGRDTFAYCLRTSATVQESNGSSSMATVCATSLSLMDAGVPIAFAISGVAMGLIKEGKKIAVLSDISGDEDHLGDMDFKVTGTQNGITALQMDIKVDSVDFEIMSHALSQAKESRIHILQKMDEALAESRTKVSSYAPKMESIKINKDKIRDLIGPGGKNIREIVEKSGAKIDIEEDGTVMISAFHATQIEQAVSMIRGCVDTPEVGNVYQAKVVKIMDFGAFVNIGNRDGLVPISEIAHARIQRVSDHLKVGQSVQVKVLGFDDRGKIRLSIKALIPKEI